MKKYGVLDRTIFSFHKSTKRQRAAVKFCELWLNIKFIGNIESSNAVSEFLSEYLDVAKQFATELSCEYSVYGH